MQKERVKNRLSTVIEDAIKHRSFSEEEMLKKGIQFITFAITFHTEVQVLNKYENE